MQEFIIGFLTTLVLVAILNKVKKGIRLKKIGFRQSMVRSLTRDMIPTNAELKKKIKTQSSINYSRQKVRVIQTPDNKAYWVDHNTFFCADVRDGMFDPSQGIPVDTSNMSKQQINELMFILDTLNKG